jgi:hypothetical protein
LLTAGLNAISTDARKQAYDAAQEQIVKDVPTDFLVRISTQSLYKEQMVGGVVKLSDGLVDITRVWRNG